MADTSLADGHVGAALAHLMPTQSLMLAVRWRVTPLMNDEDSGWWVGHLQRVALWPKEH